MSAIQSSGLGTADKAIDGYENTGTLSASTDDPKWWKVDLEMSVLATRAVIINYNYDSEYV